MNDSVFSISIWFEVNTLVSSNWNPIITRDKPPLGLFDYGLGITEKDTIIIYGGVSAGDSYTRTLKSLNYYSDLWILPIVGNVPNFLLVDYNNKVGGFSRIIYLWDETV
jgi:hypothetical protein